MRFLAPALPLRPKPIHPSHCFDYLSEAIFAYINYFLLPGGLNLAGNPWRCSCENTWIGQWQRRWLRETLQLHTDTAQQSTAMNEVVRRTTCYDPDNTLSLTPLIVLDPDIKCYSEVKVSGAERTQTYSSLLLVVTLLVAYFRTC